MKDRIKFMYEGGGASLVQILLTSEKYGRFFLNKAEYVATISKYDRSMLEELQQVRANVEKETERSGRTAKQTFRTSGNIDKQT